MTTTLTDFDVHTRQAVISQLDGDASVDASAIGVTAKDGAVTLTGYIGSYAGKLAAERVAKRVRGVRTVANDILVRPRFDRTDSDIALDVTRALELRDSVPETVQAVVRGGHVTLTGNVRALFQRRAAEQAVCHIRGVRAVHNHIDVEAPTDPGDVHTCISKALHANAELDASHISVAVEGTTAILSGSATTWFQRDAAEQAAAHTRGITSVDNRIVVRPVHAP